MAGLYFDELEIGRKFVHDIRRTVTETDNLLFTTLTHNPQPLHLDIEMERLRIVRQRREQQIVCLRHRAADVVDELPPDFQLVKIKPCHYPCTFFLESDLIGALEAEHFARL